MFFMQNSILEKQQKGEITATKSLRMLDLNGKKHCNVMVEVNFAPSKPIPESEVKGTIFTITWDDGSQGGYQLIDLCRFSLDGFSSCVTFASHGLDAFDFYNWWKERYPEVNADTTMAAYFYKKIEK